MTEVATTLDEAYRVCNPDSPLRADDERYVDLSGIRGTKRIADTVTRRVRRSAAGEALQLLFTGHRGSGKSTELFRLKATLEDERFFAVYLDVEEVLDLVEISYLDVLLAIAREMEASLREAGMPLPQQLSASISEWFAETIVEGQKTTDLNAGLTTKAQAGSEIPLLAKFLSTFTAEIKTASSRRTTTRQKLERELVVFIDKLNTLIGTARQNVQREGYKDLVLIVDGLEKMHYTVNTEGVSSHAELFVHHAEQLKAPACHIIYTLPVSLAYSANLGNDYDEIIVLPMVKTTPEGVDRLLEVISRRVAIDQVFASRELLEQLAKLSGGVIRDLMRLVRMATDTDEEKIQKDDVDYASQTLIREYDRLLRNHDIDDLKWVKTYQRAQADEAHARLLNLRLILEYQNGERWADLHPALEQIGWVRQALADE